MRSLKTLAPPFRVAVLDDYQHVAEHAADWSRLGTDVALTIFHDHVADERALVSRLSTFDALVLMRERTPMSTSLLSRLPNLRLLVTAGMANAAINLATTRELGILVCGTEVRAGGIGTIELTWALILGITHRIAAEDAAVRHGGWQLGIGTLLSGKTLGIVGLGNLGPLIVPAALAFGMRVIAWSRNLTPLRAQEVGVEYRTHDDFFREADVITIHVKLSERSAGYVGRNDFALMKPTAYLVNTSRGPIVDEKALIEALTTGRIAGAALDVYDEEPLPADHPLRYLPNTLLSPHMGYVSQDSFHDFYHQFVEDISQFLAGAPVRVLDSR